MSLDSKDIIWTATNDIYLNSKNGDIIIDAKDSINLPKIPIASSTLPSQSNEMQEQYKVCICMPDGKIFLIPTHKGNTKVNCAQVSQSMKSDPCAS